MAKKGELTKKRIMDTVIKLLKKKPLRKISVREICQEAHIAKGTFYVHFEAKEDVAFQVLKILFYDIQQDFFKIIEYPATLETAYTIIDYIIEFTTNNVAFLKIIHDESFAEYIGKENLGYYINHFNSCIKEFIVRGVNEGSFNVPNIEFTTHFISASIHELIDQFIYGNSPYTLETINKESKEIVRKLIT